MRSIQLFGITSIISMIIFSCAPRNSGIEESNEQGGIVITWKLETNFATEKGGHKAWFKIHNLKDEPLGDSGWELYWNMAPRTVKQETIDGPVTIEWINGDFYRMKPVAGFKLEPDQEIQITYYGLGSMIKESDAPLGLYIVYYDDDGKETRRVAVHDYSIEPFTTPEQINRSKDDKEPIPDPAWRFEQNQNVDLTDENKLLKVIPSPANIELASEVIVLTSDYAVYYSTNLEDEAKLLASDLKELLGEDVEIIKEAEAGPDRILLRVVEEYDPESYVLSISPKGIVIEGGDAAGLFYGTRSLLAMLPVEAYQTPKKKLELNVAIIKDGPAFGYRGFHLDVARNFNSKETVLKLLDVMAFYKLNKLHLHLTEDEAWRIEIEELPELTEIGGFRGHTLDDARYLQPAYGSGPEPDPDNSYGSGYYSREDYKEILRFATARHIEVIPEINVPGHSRAAIKAMENRYQKFMEQGNKRAAEEYRLVDPEDQSTYRSAQWYTDNVICVCQESAIIFFETVIADLVEMYKEADAPFNMIHTGGDEVPRGAWAGSPICKEFLKHNPEIDNPQNLQRYYFSRINSIIKEKGLKAGGWEEIAMNFNADGSWTSNPEFANSNVVPYIWNSLWGNQDLGYRLANAGYPVVLCNVSNYYFDLAYNKDPKEPGLYWGGLINTRDAFEYVPYDLFKSTLVDDMGRKFDPDVDFKDMERLDKDAKPNILGIQAQLWAETIKGQDMLEYYYLPKMFGLAERAWAGQASWGEIEDLETRRTAVDKDWNIFVNSIARREFFRLDYLNGGYNYRIDLPGIKLEEGVFYANISYPGLELRYTTDGTEPDENSTLYEGPVKISNGIVKIKAFNSKGRASRTSEIKIE